MMRLALCLSLVAAPPDASAAADPKVVVDVDVGEIDVVVEGWARKRVEVEADLPAGFTATLDGTAARLSVELSGRGIPASGDLRIRIPQGGELHVRTRAGDVTATGIEGAALVTTIAGSVRITGKPERVEVTTTAGDITVAGARSRVEATTVAGDIELHAPRGEVRLEAVSGGVAIHDARLDRTEISTVSGNVELAGAFAKGPHEISVHSGDIEIRVSRKQALQLQANTFSGKVHDNLASPPTSVRGAYERTLGKGGPRLELSTFDGDITLDPL